MSPQAVKKPIPITVFELTENATLPAGVNLQGEPGDLRVWNELHKSWIGVKTGDYLNVTDPKDVYPIDRDTFEKTYDLQ
jgi:hypothetical protein